ncbi:TIR domain-containing protein [Neorhodopirellula lusitana]|nr:TIR domain-containing protein [Neorhodopirellula lusitana]
MIEERSEYPEKIRIFLSASAQDKRAQQLYEELGQNGYSVWMPSRDLLAGDEWHRSSIMAMRDAAFILFCISDSSNSSRWQAEEILRGFELAGNRSNSIPMIPVLLDPSEVPKRLSQLKAVDLTNTESFRPVLEAIDGHLKREADLALSSKFDSLYVESIRIKNIRCFDSLEISFVENGLPAMWNMLLGDNAAGKTTIIRCIALGLAGESEVPSLLSKVPGDFVRSGQKSGSIDLKLRSRKTGERFSVQTKIEARKSNSQEQVRKSTKPKDFPWSQVFAAGYGTQRTRVADLSHRGYSRMLAVGTLFDPDASLMNPEVVLLRHRTDVRHRMERKLLSILLLDTDDDQLMFEEDGLAVSGPWGTLPLNVLSDGYRSTSQWILDFLGQSVLAGRLSEQNEPGGILIIDELEQHLHPKWQRLIVQRLRKQFPDTQFFTSTHTPLAASGVTDVNSGTLTRFDRHLDNVSTAERLDRHRFDGVRADQWLASDAFGLVTTRTPGAADELQRYIELVKQDQASDSAELNELRRRMSDRNTFGESEYEREIVKAVSEVLDQRRSEKPKEPFSEETKSKLREIFGKGGRK